MFYCDQCNDSFHEQCYGIVGVSEDPESRFYCDKCLWLSEGKGNKNDERVRCAICFVAFSPVKRFAGNVFFHPSCLFLSNLLKPKIGNLELEDGYTAEGIAERVKEF